MLKTILLLILLILSSCSIAPLYTPSTARSLGENENEIRGSILPSLTATYTRGLSNNLDMGIGVEQQTSLIMNGFAKYSFINNPDDGVSFAGLLGGGYGFSDGIGNSRSGYVGPILSFRNGQIEFFSSYRYNLVSWKKDKISTNTRDDLLSFIPRKSNFTYSQFDLGMSFLNKEWTVSGGAKFLVFEDGTGFVPFFDIGYKF